MEAICRNRYNVSMKLCIKYIECIYSHIDLHIHLNNFYMEIHVTNFWCDECSSCPFRHLCNKGEIVFALALSKLIICLTACEYAL